MEQVMKAKQNAEQLGGKLERARRELKELRGQLEGEKARVEEVTKRKESLEETVRKNNVELQKANRKVLLRIYDSGWYRKAGSKIDRAVLFFKSRAREDGREWARGGCCARVRGSELCYATTRCPVLSFALLRDAR
eukprot:1888738-Rhodomonas_salina.1